MRIFKKHFGKKTTYIVGDYIKNGCQIFHISRAQEVFEVFKVSLKQQKEVLEAYAENKKVEEDWETLSKSDDYNIRKIVAKQGFRLKQLINDSDWEVRETALAKLIELRNK